MPVTRYGFRHAVSVFSRMPTTAVARLLPPHVRPLEVQHGCGVVGVNAFDFTESPVGPYQEIAVVVVVPPLPTEGGMFPKAAFYPVRVATTSRRGLMHRRDAWRLPCREGTVEIAFQDLGDKINVYVYEDDDPIVDFTVSCRKWNPVDQAYQMFMTGDDRTWKADFRLSGPLSVHEEERGHVTMHRHPFWDGLDREEIEAIPFRELWMKDGVQSFAEIESLETL